MIYILLSDYLQVNRNQREFNDNWIYSPPVFLSLLCLHLDVVKRSLFVCAFTFLDNKSLWSTSTVVTDPWLSEGKWWFALNAQLFGHEGSFGLAAETMHRFGSCHCSWCHIAAAKGLARSQSRVHHLEVDLTEPRGWSENCDWRLLVSHQCLPLSSFNNDTSSASCWRGAWRRPMTLQCFAFWRKLGMARAHKNVSVAPRPAGGRGGGSYLGHVLQSVLHRIHE